MKKMNFIKDYYNIEKGELDINHINLELDKLTDEELLEQEKTVLYSWLRKNLLNTG